MKMKEEAITHSNPDISPSPSSPRLNYRENSNLKLKKGRKST